MTEVKTCVTCRHFIDDRKEYRRTSLPERWGLVCGIEVVPPPDLVTGEVRRFTRSCDDARRGDMPCGPDGKLWEAKE